MNPKEFLEDECLMLITKHDRKIEMNQSRLLAILEAYKETIIKTLVNKANTH